MGRCTPGAGPVGTTTATATGGGDVVGRSRSRVNSQCWSPIAVVRACYWWLSRLQLLSTQATSSTAVHCVLMHVDADGKHSAFFIRQGMRCCTHCTTRAGQQKSRELYAIAYLSAHRPLQAVLWHPLPPLSLIKRELEPLQLVALLRPLLLPLLLLRLHPFPSHHRLLLLCPHRTWLHMQCMERFIQSPLLAIRQAGRQAC